MTELIELMHVCMYLSIPRLLHSSLRGHVGCLHALAIVNSAAMNTGVHVSSELLFGYIPRNGIAGSYGSSIISFLRNLHTVLHRGYTNLQSHQVQENSLFSTPSPSFIYRLLMMATLTFSPLI